MCLQSCKGSATYLVALTIQTDNPIVSPRGRRGPLHSPCSWQNSVLYSWRIWQSWHCPYSQRPPLQKSSHHVVCTSHTMGGNSLTVHLLEAATLH